MKEFLGDWFIKNDRIVNQYGQQVSFSRYHSIGLNDSSATLLLNNSPESLEQGLEIIQNFQQARPYITHFDLLLSLINLVAERVVEAESEYSLEVYFDRYKSFIVWPEGVNFEERHACSLILAALMQRSGGWWWSCVTQGSVWSGSIEAVDFAVLGRSFSAHEALNYDRQISEQILFLKKELNVP